MIGRPRPGARKPASRTGRDAATTLAIAALSFLAAEPDRIGRFLALSGIGPESLRVAAQDREFLVGVLDHLASEETLLIGFAEQNEIDPEQVMRAREALAGPGWERDTP